MNNASIQVSVVIPTHHRRDLLKRLLTSLQVQSLAPSQFEVLIVHNHTDDGTEIMAQQWCAEQVFSAQYFKKNFNGPAQSRDFGARAALGRVVAFIDDDCVASPDWLRAGLAAFDAPQPSGGPEVGVVQGQTTPMPDQAKPFLSKTIDIQAPTVYFETCNIFYRKSVFDAVDGFSADFIDRFYGEDTDLGWKVTQAGYASWFVPEALVHHEIFHVSFYKWLAEPLYFKNLPYLVKKYPALRQHMYMKYFISKDSCLFNLLPLALLVLPWAGAWALLLPLPYFWERYRNGRHIRRIHFRLIRAAVGVLRSAFTWWALASGSWRAKSLLM
ncbi:glycosyltransferase family 2 protein [Ottowia thiooxydans]|uniref:glycosyltransferase family 2 protein n=1 Tax=Ottowia thiooxydans TaxID=219182 RepID=UPI00048F161B|nr:glycosyltransferase [Ottowia thiooxydans]